MQTWLWCGQKLLSCLDLSSKVLWPLGKFFFSINGPNGLIFGQWVDMGNILKITEGIRDFLIFCGFMARNKSKFWLKSKNGQNLESKRSIKWLKIKKSQIPSVIFSILSISTYRPKMSPFSPFLEEKNFPKGHFETRFLQKIPYKWPKKGPYIPFSRSHISETVWDLSIL